jgi:hypothetical protein
MDERVAFFRIAVGAEDAWSAAPKLPPDGAPKAAVLGFSAPKPPASRPSAPKPFVPKPSAPRPVAAAAATQRNAGTTGGGPVARMQAAIAEAMTDPEWKEF